VSRSPRLLRRLGAGLVLLGLLALLIAALYLAASAEGLGNRYAALYPWLFLGAGAAVLVLALAVLARLLKLRGQLKRGEPGARLTRRLLVLLLVLALPPVLLVFAFSLRFVGASIDTWLRANSVEALESALELARMQLDERRSDAQQRSERVAELLLASRFDLGAGLEDALDSVEASQLVLFQADGRVRHVAAADPALLLPAPPDESARALLGSRSRQLGVERIGEASYVRVLQGVEIGGDALLLQALYPLPARYVELSDRVEAAAFGTRQALFLRDSLKLLFVLILSLVALLSMFLAVLIAFDLARRLVSPIGRLAAATRAVAEGRLEPVEVPVRGDELGFLVESFNRMTAELSASRERAAASSAETERQRAFLATVLSRLSSAVLVLGPEAKLRSANPAAAELSGLPADRLEGLTLEEFALACPSLATLAEVAGARLSEGAPEWREELSIEPETGERRLLLLRGASLPGGGQVLVIDDTTAVDRARRDAAWSEVARRLAHEVKNPLTPIQLSAERLRRRVLPRLKAEDAEVLDRATRTIVGQVDALKTLVNAFGEYARPPQLALATTDVGQLVDEVLDLYENDPRTHIERVYGAGLRLRVDPGRLRQVLHNLVKNAQEASAERDQLRLRIGLSEATAGGRSWIDLSVEDDGPGLPAGFSSDWFEPYRSTKAKGTGLGLAISRKIAEEHGGQLLVETAETGGARFVLRLPC